MRNLLIVSSIFALAVASLGLTACDSGGASSCEQVMQHMKEISKEELQKMNSKMKKDMNVVEMYTKACKETNSMEKHSKTMNCIAKASSKKDMEKCEGFADVQAKWGQHMVKQMKNKMGQ